MPVETRARRVSQSRLGELAREVLEDSTLCAVATVSRAKTPHVNTVYFAWSPDLDLVWLSDPDSRHSRNLGGNHAAAVAVYDSTQTWGRADRGVQLFGSARLAGRSAAGTEAVYAARFPEYDPLRFTAYRLYRFRPRTLKLFDEQALGGGVFVTARCRSGALEWRHTEVVVGAPTRGSTGRARARPA
jgi:uncharacterized protein YhbP (UPF0306 family)